MSHQLFTIIKWSGVLSDGYRSLMALGSEEFGRDVAVEVESELQLLTEMVPALSEQLAQERARV